MSESHSLEAQKVDIHPLGQFIEETKPQDIETAIKDLEQFQASSPRGEEQDLGLIEKEKVNEVKDLLDLQLEYSEYEDPLQPEEAMDPLRLFAESLSMKEDPISYNLIDIESSPENILLQNQHHQILQNPIIPPPMQTDLQQFPHLIPFNQETQFTQQVDKVTEEVVTQIDPLQNIKTFIQSAKFRSCIQFCDKQLKNDNHSVVEILFLKQIKIYCLMKIHDFNNAKNVLESLKIEEIDFQDEDSNLKGSKVSFVLQYLSAILPMFLNKKEGRITTLNKLYVLLKSTKDWKLQKEATSHTEVDLQTFGESETKNELSQETAEIVKEYEEMFGLFPVKNDFDNRKILLFLELAKIHCYFKEYRKAYSLLKEACEEYTNDPILYSSLGRLCLEIGRRPKAEACFDLVQSELEETLQIKPFLDARINFLISFQKGLLNIYDGKFAEAIENFRNCLTSSPGNVIALNNLAICSAYCNDFKRAFDCLEKVLKADVNKNTQDPILLNLKNLYDHYYIDNEKKKEAIKDFLLKNLTIEYSNLNALTLTSPF